MIQSDSNSLGIGYASVLWTLLVCSIDPFLICYLGYAGSVVRRFGFTIQYFEKKKRIRTLVQIREHYITYTNTCVVAWILQEVKASIDGLSECSIIFQISQLRGLNKKQMNNSTSPLINAQNPVVFLVYSNAAFQSPFIFAYVVSWKRYCHAYLWSPDNNANHNTGRVK